MSYLQTLRNAGFEDSRHIPFTKQYRVRCTSCEALVIQGTPCHETGCPEQRKECKECGGMFKRSEGCPCMEPCEDDFFDYFPEDAEEAESPTIKETP